MRLGQRTSQSVPSRHPVLIFHDPLAGPVVDASSSPAATCRRCQRLGCDHRGDPYRSCAFIKNARFERFATVSLPGRDAYLWTQSPPQQTHTNDHFRPPHIAAHAPHRRPRLPSSASAHPAATHGATSQPPVQTWWQIRRRQALSLLYSALCPHTIPQADRAVGPERYVPASSPVFWAVRAFGPPFPSPGGHPPQRPPPKPRHTLPPAVVPLYVVKRFKFVRPSVQFAQFHSSSSLACLLSLSPKEPYLINVRL